MAKKLSNPSFELNAQDLILETMRLSCAQLGKLFNEDMELLMSGGTPVRPWIGRIYRRAGNRPGISPQRRKAVLERDGFCQNCATSENLEIDHIVPVADGGTSEIENLQALCRPCNQRKGPRVWHRQRAEVNQ